MTVNRHNDSKGPSLLTVFFKGSSSLPLSDNPDPNTRAPLPEQSDRTETIEMRGKPDSEILAQLLELTQAVSYEQTADETAELEELANERKKRDKDRERQSKFNEKLKYEKALLQQARESTS